MTQAQPELAVGKRNHVRVRGVYHLICRRPQATEYHVELCWPTMARYDADDESFNCGCDFAGRAHAHKSITVADADAAEALYGQAKLALLTQPANAVARTLGLSE